jgi:NAD(P)-dependent dehydrogenase (short-subunit alcohol dehydrogenase family)
MSEPFDGKVALITGAGSGIGLATALAFARRGAKVAAVARDDRNGREVVERIRTEGGTAEFIQADMTKITDIAEMVRRTVEVFGQLDVAFNNAGTTGEAALLHEQNDEEWNQVIATNLTAVFHCMKHEIAQMLIKAGGVIVNNASGSGVMAQPYLSPYCASKHAILGLTKTAAREYANCGIRINAVCPGLTLTPQLERYFAKNRGAREALVAEVPMRRIAEPTEIANAVVWLCSPEASYISGESLFIDGALTCH